MGKQSLMDKQSSVWQKFDYGLMFLVFLLSLFSLIAIYAATSHHEDPYSFVTRQIMWYGIGFAVLIGTLLFDYRQLKSFSVIFYVIGVLMLILVSFVGKTVGGAKRWIEIGPINLQPSEFMKIFLIIGLAHYLSKQNEILFGEQQKRLFKTDLWLTTKVGAISIIPFAIVLRQPDLGTALVLLAIVGVMLFASGLSWRMLTLLFLLGTGLIVGLIFLYFVNPELFNMLIKSHQMDRIYGWLDPEEHHQTFALQLLNAMMAIGSGQLMGQAFTERTQPINVPELQTDFIFAVIGQEFGFVGASVLIATYFILVYRLVQIALTCKDSFGSYMVAGVICMIVFQVFENIGMTIGLMPITGLALPFISYGGSALITNMMAIGIVLNVNMRTKEYMFE